jgi:hypothetical protein
MIWVGFKDTRRGKEESDRKASRKPRGTRRDDSRPSNTRGAQNTTEAEKAAQDDKPTGIENSSNHTQHNPTSKAPKGHPQRHRTPAKGRETSRGKES